MCSDPPKRDCNHSWQVKPLTLHSTHNTPPVFTETTDRLTYYQLSLFFYTLAWWNYQKILIGQPVTLHTLPSLWLVSLCPHTPSLLPDWSVWMGPYTIPVLWLVSLNEHMHLCEWAHNHGEIQWKIKTDTHRQTHPLTSAVLSPPFSAGNKDGISFHEAYLYQFSMT